MRNIKTLQDFLTIYDQLIHLLFEIKHKKNRLSILLETGVTEFSKNFLIALQSDSNRRYAYYTPIKKKFIT